MSADLIIKSYTYHRGTVNFVTVKVDHDATGIQFIISIDNAKC